MYFGTGLSTTRAMSRGFPYDLLGMFATAVKLRRHLNLGKVIHEISDTHANSNEFVNPQEVDRLAKHQMDQIGNMINYLGLTEEYEVRLASEYQNNSEYNELLADMSEKYSDAPEYAQRQWAGMAWLRDYDQVVLKLSWLIDEKSKPGFDERYFDFNFPQSPTTPMSFIYTPCGRNFDLSRSRVCPYSSPEGEERILLSSSFNAEAFLRPYQDVSKKGIKKVIEHLDLITSAFEDVFGSTGEVTLGKRIDAIIESTCNVSLG
jgi:hypothetical protein